MGNELYLILGSIILLLKVHTTEGYTANCNYLSKNHVECYKKSSKNGVTIPPDLSSKITEIKLSSYNSSSYWLINSLDYFQRFPDLTSIYIEGLVNFSDNLKESRMKEELKQLFYLPKLKSLICNGTGFDNEYYLWKLPRTMEILSFANNQYSEYNFTHYPYLSVLDFENNALAKMPRWYVVPSPISTLLLQGNPSLRVTFDDLSMYCKLTEISLNIKSSFRYPDLFCDCIRVKKWLEEFDIRIISKDSDKIECLMLNATMCSNYKIDEYEQRREKCLREKPPRVRSLASRSKIVLLFMLILIIILLFIISFGVIILARTLVNYVYFTPRVPLKRLNPLNGKRVGKNK